MAPNKKIKVGERWVGEGEPCFVIAEAGSNHNHDLNLAKELIQVAAEAGADAVKFQSLKFEELYLPHLADRETVELYQRIELPEEWYEELSNYALANGILFLSSPTYFRAVDLLEQIGVKAYKIASPQASTFLPLVRYIARQQKPIFLSSGYADYKQISRAIESCHEESNREIVLLHCVTQYPTPPADANLRMMNTLRKRFHLPIGFSDHTLGYNITNAARAMGAVAIEKHFTLSHKLEGPDHSFALEPAELSQMIRQIREVEQSLGDGVKKKRSKAEREFISKIEVKLVTAEDIKQGTSINRQMLEYKRAPYGITTKDEERVLRYKAAQPIPKGTPLTWDRLKPAKDSSHE